MLTIKALKGIDVLMVSFRRGDYIIEELREYLKENNIDAALITSGIGSFDICKIHIIEHAELPPKDKYITIEGPVEVSSLLGSVAGGEPHIHVTVKDVNGDRVYVGHLEAGSRCCYRVEMGLLILKDIRTRRVTNPETGLIDIEMEE